MIHVQIVGGLGNQLFIYAFARAMQLETGEAVVLHDIHTAPIPEAEISVVQLIAEGADITCIHNSSIAEFYAHLPIRRFIMKYMSQLCKLLSPSNMTRAQLERKLQPILLKMGIFYITDGYVPVKRPRLLRNFYCGGYFQSPHYWGSYRSQLCRELYRPDLIGSRNHELLDQIQSRNSVCVHVRLGDYLDDALKHIFYVCDSIYYQRAVERAVNDLDNPLLVIFSNEPENAKNLLILPDGIRAIYVQPGNTPMEELQLMAQCRHFVISNSSFSWWAQCLGQYPEKRVYAPKRWVRTDIPVDLYEDDWIIVDTPIPQLE